MVICLSSSLTISHAKMSFAFTEIISVKKYKSALTIFENCADLPLIYLCNIFCFQIKNVDHLPISSIVTNIDTIINNHIKEYIFSYNVLPVKTHWLVNI